MLSIIIVGINGWEEYTRPLIAGIWTHHPDMELCVIDNASDTPYPKGDHIHRLDKRVSYAEAINYGIDHTHRKWIMVLNHDVRCEGAFLHLLDGLNEDAIYSRQIITEQGHTWFGMWVLIVNRGTNWRIGGFDEKFEMCGFEDTDYAMRAAEIGIPVKPIELPFRHLWGKTRWNTPGYTEARLRNIDYFEKKHGWRPGEHMSVIHE